MRRVYENQVLIVRVDGDVTDCRAVLDEVLGYGRLQGLKHLAILDELNISTFLVDLHSKRRHLMPPDVDAEPTLSRGHN